MKMLKGSLKETLYDWPDDSLLQEGQSAPPAIIKETIYNENQVAYISGKALFFALYIPAC
jgi:cysteine dioxygenase